MSLGLILSSLLSAVAIEHVLVEVGDGRVLDDATVIIDQGKIVALGGPVPQGATRIDGRGKTLTPGLLDFASDLGIAEISQEDATVDQGDPHAVFAPGFRVAEGYNPLSPRIAIARQEGVTSAVLAPTHGLLAGEGHWVALTGLLQAGPDLAHPVVQFGAVGADVKGLVGGARGGVWLRLREVLADARWYAKNRAAVEQNRARSLSLSPLHLEALQPLLAGKVPLVVRANRASDILAALRWAKEEKLRLIILGGAEAWLVSAELRQAQVPVVLVPSEQKPATFDALHVRDDAASFLDAAGVQIAVACADFGRRRLRQEAGIAVAYGLPRARALMAITLVPARLAGMESELGSVEVGKRADLVLWSGDPLELSTRTEKVFIAGVEQSLVTRQTKLVERYLSTVKAKH